MALRITRVVPGLVHRRIERSGILEILQCLFVGGTGLLHCLVTLLRAARPGSILLILVGFVDLLDAGVVCGLGLILWRQFAPRHFGRRRRRRRAASIGLCR